MQGPGFICRLQVRVPSTQPDAVKLKEGLRFEEVLIGDRAPKVLEAFKLWREAQRVGGKVYTNVADDLFRKADASKQHCNNIKQQYYHLKANTM